MKKVMLFCALCTVMCTLTSCMRKCESEPIVAENHKLIVPPHFGDMPK
ncbi:MAG: hypothetical protein IJ560_02715 [Alphaproteobacteria bacterium]|nr:hypothetical protein [Alphaproteobacteria bacterium]